MCGGKKSSAPAPAPTPTVAINPNNVADNSNDAGARRQAVIASTGTPSTTASTFGSELGG